MTKQTHTRLGKEVGSYRRPLESHTYWAENNWDTNEPGFMVVYPSGARYKWVATESEAKALVRELNAR